MAKTRLGSAMVIGLIAVATAVLGCGEDGNSLNQFVGTWEYVQSTGTFTCDGIAPTAANFSGRKIWGEGVTSDLVDLTDNCNYKFDVKNKDATIAPMQNCVFPSGDTEIPSSWRFTLLSATTAEEVATTTLEGTSCVFMVGSQLSKISKD